MVLKMRKPLYMDIADEIKRRISEGIYKPEEKLASEPALAEELGISRGTLREALTSLENEGIIARKHGRGSFVNKKPDTVFAGIERLDSLVSTIRQAGHVAQDKVITIAETGIEHRVAEMLDVKAESTGYVLESIRFSDDVPVIYCYDILPAHLFENKNLLKARYRCDSLTDFFDKHTRYRPKKFVATANALLPPPEVAELLNISASQPMIFLEGVMYDDDDKPINYGYQYYRGDKYQFKLVRSR